MQAVANANPEDLVKELADLAEVIDTVLTVYEISRDAVLAEQEGRRCQCGGLKKRLKLLWAKG